MLHRHIKQPDPELSIFADRGRQLLRGLKAIAQEHPDILEPAQPVVDGFREDWDPLLANWEQERLSPRSCNLRSAVIMAGGVYTGAKGLAQETRPQV